MGLVRIIGGVWRGRKITVPEVNGVRPSLDRIRETVFNWLAPDIVDANCLDLFAGSGALGFEALSRGASHVCFVDSSVRVLSTLTDNALTLTTNQVTVVKGSVPSAVPVLRGAPFNIIFLDPPFRQNRVKQSLTWLLQQQYLSPEALIYIEAEKEFGKLTEPDFEVIKYKETGSLCYQLVARQLT